jgi:hypothetical protein
MKHSRWKCFRYTINRHCQLTSTFLLLVAELAYSTAEQDVCTSHKDRNPSAATALMQKPSSASLSRESVGDVALSQVNRTPIAEHGLPRKVGSGKHADHAASVKTASVAEKEIESVHIGGDSKKPIYVVAISDQPTDDRVSVLKQSLHAGGFSTNNFHYVGNGEFSWTRRLEIMQHMVENAAAEDPQTVFLFIDAFDVFTLGTPEELMRKFEKTSKDILFSCITYPYPHNCEGLDWVQEGVCNRDSHWGAQCQHWCRFACAGAFMGKAGALAQVFAESPIHMAGTRDDQCYFNKVFAEKSHRNYNIALDYRHDVFFSTMDLRKCSLRKKNGRFHVVSSGATPLVIHFDTSHPTAGHLQSNWRDVLTSADGPVCTSSDVCTDWCWDWDIGDMPGRLTQSDKQLFRELNWVIPDEQFLTSKLLVLVWVNAAVIVSVLGCAVWAYHSLKDKQESKN